jgi:tetratricopeptide (TPR) repeat protein
MVETTLGNKRLKIEGLTRELTKSHFSKDERANEFRRRFVAHFLRYAQAHAKTTPEDFAALEAEKDNILSAMDVAFGLTDWSSVMRLMKAINLDGVHGLLTMHGYWDEAIQRGAQAVAAAYADQNETSIAVFAGNIAIIRQNRGEYDEAKQAYSQAVAAFRKLGNETNVAVGLHLLAVLAQNQGKVEEARRLYDESLEIKKRLGDQSGIAITLHNLAVLAQAQGESEEARRLYNESLEIKKRLGNQSGIAITLGQLGSLAEQEGDRAEAARLLREALSIFERLKSPNAEIVRRMLARLEDESS